MSESKGVERTQDSALSFEVNGYLVTVASQTNGLSMQAFNKVDKLRRYQADGCQIKPYAGDLLGKLRKLINYPDVQISAVITDDEFTLKIPIPFSDSDSEVNEKLTRVKIDTNMQLEWRIMELHDQLRQLKAELEETNFKRNFAVQATFL